MEIRSQLRLIGAAGEALGFIVEEVIDFSSLDRGEVELVPGRFNMPTLLRRLVGLAREIVADKPITVAVEVDDASCADHLGDERRLAEVLLHLIRNAAKFTREGYILITAESHSVGDGCDRWRVVVRDSGVGIPPGHLARICEPFQQADLSDTRAYGGLGLGLAISSSLLRLMGGRLEVSSTEGAGSAFAAELVLPRAQEPAAAQPKRRNLDCLVAQRGPAASAAAA